MDRNLVMNLARVTEAAALSSAPWLGRGEKNAADGAAVEAMRRMFDTVDIDGTVVIGEGEIDEAPMLYIGEKIGDRKDGAIKVDIAVDPLDGTNSIANGMPNAISVVAVAPAGCLLHAPDMYMNKIAVGPKAKGVVDIEKSVTENLKAVAKALNKEVSETTVVMLNRPRHDAIVKELRENGARIKFINDGDVIAAIQTCFEDTNVDMLLGSGGAPEGVLAAAALKCMGGEMQGKLLPKDEKEKERCIKMGINPDKILHLDDLVKGDEIAFSATGVSHGELLDGVKFIKKNVCETETLVRRAETGTIRFIKATHILDKKPKYAK